MLKGAIGERYAEALYELAKEGGISEKVEQELLAIKKIIEDEKDLQRILYHPRITNENKKQLLKELFEGKISEVTFSFLQLLIERQREQYFADIVDYFINKANLDRNILSAKVSSAVELSDEEKKALKEVLSKISGKEMVTNFLVEPDLIGGIVVRIGDRVIDGSVKTKFSSMREFLRQIG